MAHVLIFSRTTDYRHESIEHAVEVLTELAAQDGHTADHTEDAGAFAPASLDRYRVVVWLSTSGDVLDDGQREAFRQWLLRDGAWMGVHSATACEQGWPEYEQIAGAVFTDHPEVQRATVHRAVADHPSTAHLPAHWSHTDEWYNFRGRPPADRTVLLTVDEDSYVGGTMGAAHPIAWAGRYRPAGPAGSAAGADRGARTWYTALGHLTESYDDPMLQAHLLGGLRSVLEPR